MRQTRASGRTPPRAAWRFRVPAVARRWLRRAVRRARWGNLRRFRPISAKFGFDRGTPIDRRYMEEFLASNADAIRGVVGEVADRRFTEHFGGDAVSRSEVLDLDPDNPEATLVVDIARAGALPVATFDCLIVTQVLQYVAQPTVAVRELVAALRPGGTLLLAVPALTAHDPHEELTTDRWRFWPAGLVALIEQAAPEATAHVAGYGNLVATIALLHGLCAEELDEHELGYLDERFPVVVCARVDVGPVARAMAGPAVGAETDRDGGSW